MNIGLDEIVELICYRNDQKIKPSPEWLTLTNPNQQHLERNGDKRFWISMKSKNGFRFVKKLFYWHLSSR